MKRSAAAMTAVIMLCATLGWAADAWARTGGGGSSGSRGSRSYSAPARPSSQPTSPATPVAPAPASPVQPLPQRSGWGAGLMGGLGGLLLGGLIGSMLFGGMGGGLGGFGLIELLMLGALAFFAFSWLRRRQAQPAPAAAYGTQSASGPPAWVERSGAGAGQTATIEAPPAPQPSDLDRGIGHIRQVDAAFDPTAFAGTASQMFREIQSAWTRRDMGGIAGILTPEMQTTLQKDCDGLRAQGKVNRLEQIAVRSAQVTEAWQEQGQDYVTVRLEASLIDYTTDEQGKVLDGNPREPIGFEEFWTFTRPVWAKTWRLSAIQQPV